MTGNPIFEVLRYYDDRVRGSMHARTVELRGGVFLVTRTRAENVDDPARLRTSAAARPHAPRGVGRADCGQHSHPALARLAELGEPAPAGIRASWNCLAFSTSFILNTTARCVLTDSGTVQEECAF